MSCARPRGPHAQPHRSSSFHHLPCCLSSSFSEQYGVQRNRGQLTQTMRSAGMDTERRRLVSLALPPRSVSDFQKSDSAPCDIVLDVCSAECQGQAGHEKPASVALGRVDGFDDDEAQSECDEGSEVLVRLLAAQRNALEALELADEVF